MNQKPKTPSSVKVALGVVLPVAAFAIYDLCLTNSLSGKGEAAGFAGTGLALAFMVVIPALLVVNSLLMIPQWKSKVTIVAVGFIFPVIIAIAEYRSLHGR